MSRFNPRLIAVALSVVVMVAAFKFSQSEFINGFTPPAPTNLSSDWGKFAASDTKLTAFALMGTEDNNGKPQEWIAAQPQFFDEVVLSQTEVKNPANRRDLRDAFARIIPDHYQKSCIPNYRHALRFEKNGRTLDAKICFGCGDVEISDSKGKRWHSSLNLPDSESLDQFDAIFVRMGMKQFKPDENQ